MYKKIGKQTIQFQNPPVIVGTATIVGQREGEGPLGKNFDKVVVDNYYGEDSWEKAERRMMEEAVKMVLQKAGLKNDDVDFFLAGDLLNQIITANFTARDVGIPFLGLYGACATMYEGMLLGSVLIDGGFARHVLVASGSHYSTAERQFRFPVEQGTQRPVTSQVTVTGTGAAVLGSQGTGPVITHATVGRVIDLGSGDPMDMGAAMAPAAADTIYVHLQDTGRGPDYYDLYITGDLGVFGKKLADELLKQRGIDISQRLTDCGILIYSPEQDPHAGGSGCGCVAVVTCGYLVRQLVEGKLRRVLGVGTGALMSPDTTLQGETIPAIGHALAIEAR